MAIVCPACGRQYDVTLFQFDNRVQCECGKWFDRSTANTEPAEERSYESNEADEERA